MNSQRSAVQLDDLSDDDGSPNGRNKRVHANRLSAQRSRQRKLEKEATLTKEVDVLKEEVAKLAHEEKSLMELEQGEIRDLHLPGRALTTYPPASERSPRWSAASCTAK